MRSTRFAALLPLLALLGCSSGSNSGTSTGNGSSTSPTGDAPGSSCDQYLQCVAAATPDALPVALQAYGPSGTCWGGSATLAADCEAACKESMGTVPGGGAFAALCGPQHGSGDGTANSGTTSSSDSDGGTGNGTITGSGSGSGSGSDSGSGSGGSTTESCKDCAEKLCATPRDDCEVSTSCTDTFTCIGTCNAGDTSCDDTCDSAGSSVGDQETITNLSQCLNASCGGICDPL